MARGIVAAFRSGNAAAFFAEHYTDPEARRRAVQRSARPLAPAVAQALVRQNARFAASPARETHLAALADGAAAVVTGQQVGLFLGPLYTVYKAASAICVARALAAESGQPVVPIFWLQTEDHDLPEIAACNLPVADGPPLALQLPASASDRIAVAHCLLPSDITLCLARLREALANLPQGDAHVSRVARYYRPGESWAAAFAGLLAELFAPEGLVLIDPRDPTLAPHAAPIHHHALTRAETIAAALAERGRALEAASFAEAVHIRPGAPLSFFHPTGPTGPRYRLDPVGDGFAEVGGDGIHSTAALLAALDADPLRFSTSALLRPLLQDTWLPTAAYVGGPGEVAYFAQLAPLYAAFDLPMPLIVPRAHFRILEDKTQRLLARLHLTADDAARSADEILAIVHSTDAGILGRSALAQALLGPFDKALHDVRGRIEEAAPDLTAAIEKTRASVAAAVAKLAGKYEKALRHQDQTVVDAVHRLQRTLYPTGVPQERFYGLPYFAARYGERAFIERVIAAVDPFDPTSRDLTWSSTDPSAVVPPGKETHA